MRFGYARVSTKEQNLDRQLDQLAAANVDRVFSDKISGAKESRPELDKMLSMLREGDTVIVCSYDRLARSSKQLFDLAERFNANGIALVSLKEGTDTSTPQGRFFFAMCAAMAQFERELIKERQAEGIAAAKARGRQFGRPATDPSKMCIRDRTSSASCTDLPFTSRVAIELVAIAAPHPKVLNLASRMMPSSSMSR